MQKPTVCQKNCRVPPFLNTVVQSCRMQSFLYAVCRLRIAPIPKRSCATLPNAKPPRRRECSAPLRHVSPRRRITAENNKVVTSPWKSFPRISSPTSSLAEGLSITSFVTTSRGAKHNKFLLPLAEGLSITSFRYHWPRG